MLRVLGEKNLGALFFLKRNYVYVVCNMETTYETGHWERHRSPTMANGEYSINMFLSFLSIDLGAAMLAPSYS